MLPENAPHQIPTAFRTAPFNLTVTDIINAIQSQNVQPQSPKKREFFKYLPETIGYFAPELHKFGVYRLTAGSRKHAIGGPFCEY